MYEFGTYWDLRQKLKIFILKPIFSPLSLVLLRPMIPMLIAVLAKKCLESVHIGLVQHVLAHH